MNDNIQRQEQLKQMYQRASSVYPSIKEGSNSSKTLVHLIEKLIRMADQINTTGVCYDFEELLNAIAGRIDDKEKSASKREKLPPRDNDNSQASVIKA